jgi:hypothetical protein
MEKIIFLLGMSFLICGKMMAQADTAIWRVNAQDQARRLDSAFKEKNWMRYAKLNHPKLVQLMGGEDAFAQTMKDEMHKVDSLVKIDTMYFGTPYYFVSCDSSINCLLPQTMLIELNDTSLLRSRVYLVGSSEDKGRTWYFVDGSNGAQFLDEVISNRCKNLVIPDKQQKFIRRKDVEFGD